MSKELQIRIQDADGPTLIYLPGTHGDWTLNSGFRRAVNGHARFVEFTFPRTLSWSLADHANAIEKKLLGNKIERGWILAESFGSQVAWAWVGQSSKTFQIEGIILAGGFVRHPFLPAVHSARFLTQRIPEPLLRGILRCYVVFARLRDNSPETCAALEEFVSRRTREDLAAAAHRLRLIAQADLRQQAYEAGIPVFYVSGLFDPVVPWPSAWAGLRKHCPGFRGFKLIWNSDHHVLGAAAESSRIILDWMSRECPGSASPPFLSRLPN